MEGEPVQASCEAPAAASCCTDAEHPSGCASTRYAPKLATGAHPPGAFHHVPMCLIGTWFRLGKRSLEYLFLGDHPGLPGMMDEIVEAGVQPASEFAAKASCCMQEQLSP